VTLTYLLDTNILSEPLKPQPNPGIIHQLQTHAAACATASIVLHELFYGCYRLPAGRKREYIEDYLHDVVLDSLPILAYTPAAAQWHAQERARLEKCGLTPPFADGQIAAVAQAYGLILVTRNLADYAHFKIKAEDWAVF
jgi:tRNA(fMet)-specific endonuclease VapC